MVETFVSLDPWRFTNLNLYFPFMKRRTFLKRTGTAGIITFIRPSDLIHFFKQDSPASFENDFRNPPAASYPQNMWFWVNGNVSKEGITLDLEAMKRVGISGFFNFDVGTGIPKGPVTYLSKEWVELKKHAIREAQRLGLEFVMHNCPGWSSSGGPWITPQLAMQQITWSESFVSGNKPINLYLPKPPSRLDYYRDIAVIAFPSLEREDLLQYVRISSSNREFHNDVLSGKHQEQGMVVHSPGKNQSAWLQFEFAEPYEVKQLTFFISAIPTEASVTIPLEFGERTSISLEVSDDGVKFRQVTPINTGLETELLISDKFIVFDIPVTTAKYFRFASSKTRRYRQVQFSGITRLKNWMEKANHRMRTSTYVSESSTIEQNNEQKVSSASIVDFDAVLDISKYLDEDGFLKWNSPVGNWTILRIGFTPTGVPNRSAPDTGVGLECDKYSKQAFEFHFNKMMEYFLPVIKELTVKGKMGLEIDSYEAGAQNWTIGFEDIFRKSRGYVIKKYLPVLAGGRIVSNVDLTERFLWDLRRVQADLIANNYYGYFHELCKQHGITAYMEPYESGPMEEMQIGSRADVNLGEFWSGIFTVAPIKRPFRRSLKLASSIAHINGQQVVGAEAFTSDPDSSRWQEYPFALKALGDKAFVTGINRLVIHRFAHQPHSTAVPGMTMGPFGIHFERTTTWWNQSSAWLKYLARCQNMLQQGRYVADLAYFSGEDANMYTHTTPEELSPPPLDGYDYDMINAETIFKYSTMIDGQLTLLNGVTYKIFVLQNYKAVTITLLQKLREMVKEGMVLIGAKPERSAGLKNYSKEDAGFKNIADELWGDIDGNSFTEKQFGKGYIYWGKPLFEIFRSLNIKPDFEFTSRSGDAPVIYTHRKTKDSDIYFLSNQRRSFEDLVCTFRVYNKRPELWNPATGENTAITVYDLIGDRIQLPVQLEPYGSAFIIFRSAASSNSILSVQKNNEPLLSAKHFPLLKPTLNEDVFNSFSISFSAKPEINILLNPAFIMGSISHPWTEFYAIYPAAGKKLYGEGHAICGVTVGRNGVAVWENVAGTPELVLPAAVSISGWSHIVITYNDGIPSVYVNGKLVQAGKKSASMVHPYFDQTYLNEGASYYNGDMTKPVLFNEVLNEDRIRILSNEKHPSQHGSFIVEMTGYDRPAFLIKENGNYILTRRNGGSSSILISEIGQPVEIQGPWQLTFPANMGAPSQITLPKLISLHKHDIDSIKYFSGTTTYTNQFTFSKKSSDSKRYFLNLGMVEVIAEVKLNEKEFGVLWKRPYEIDITAILKDGLNKLEIKVTNLWPNRLIGDEQLADPDKFTPGGGLSGLEGLTGGYIEHLPDWFTQNKPKPKNGRVCFTTWKHYLKTSPLLESGLIGPVTIRQAVVKQI
jgi:hypothetical protein